MYNDMQQQIDAEANAYMSNPAFMKQYEQDALMSMLDQCPEDLVGYRIETAELREQATRDILDAIYGNPEAPSIVYIPKDFKQFPMANTMITADFLSQPGAEEHPDQVRLHEAARSVAIELLNTGDTGCNNFDEGFMTLVRYYLDELDPNREIVGGNQMNQSRQEVQQEFVPNQTTNIADVTSNLQTQITGSSDIKEKENIDPNKPSNVTNVMSGLRDYYTNNTQQLNAYTQSVVNQQYQQVPMNVQMVQPQMNTIAYPLPTSQYTDYLYNIVTFNQFQTLLASKFPEFFCVYTDGMSIQCKTIPASWLKGISSEEYRMVQFNNACLYYVPEPPNPLDMDFINAMMRCREILMLGYEIPDNIGGGDLNKEGNLDFIPSPYSPEFNKSFIMQKRWIDSQKPVIDQSYKFLTLELYYPIAHYRNKYYSAKQLVDTGAYIDLYKQQEEEIMRQHSLDVAVEDSIDYQMSIKPKNEPAVIDFSRTFSGVPNEQAGMTHKEENQVNTVALYADQLHSLAAKTRTEQVMHPINMQEVYTQTDIGKTRLNKYGDKIVDTVIDMTPQQQTGYYQYQKPVFDKPFDLEEEYLYTLTCIEKFKRQEATLQMNVRKDPSLIKNAIRINKNRKLRGRRQYDISEFTNNDDFMSKTITAEEKKAKDEVKVAPVKLRDHDRMYLDYNEVHETSGTGKLNFRYETYFRGLGIRERVRQRIKEARLYAAEQAELMINLEYANDGSKIPTYEAIVDLEKKLYFNQFEDNGPSEFVFYALVHMSMVTRSGLHDLESYANLDLCRRALTQETWNKIKSCVRYNAFEGRKDLFNKLLFKCEEFIEERIFERAIYFNIHPITGEALPEGVKTVDIINDIYNKRKAAGRTRTKLPKHASRPVYMISGNIVVCDDKELCKRAAEVRPEAFKSLTDEEYCVYKEAEFIRSNNIQSIDFLNIDLEKSGMDTISVNQWNGELSADEVREYYNEAKAMSNNHDVHVKYLASKFVSDDSSYYKFDIEKEIRERELDLDAIGIHDEDDERYDRVIDKAREPIENKYPRKADVKEVDTNLKQIVKVGSKKKSVEEVLAAFEANVAKAEEAKKAEQEKPVLKDIVRIVEVEEPKEDTVEVKPEPALRDIVRIVEVEEPKEEKPVLKDIVRIVEVEEDIVTVTDKAVNRIAEMVLEELVEEGIIELETTTEETVEYSFDKEYLKVKCLEFVERNAKDLPIEEIDYDIVYQDSIDEIATFMEWFEGRVDPEESYKDFVIHSINMYEECVGNEEEMRYIRDNQDALIEDDSFIVFIQAVLNFADAVESEIRRLTPVEPLPASIYSSDMLRQELAEYITQSGDEANETTLGIMLRLLEEESNNASQLDKSVINESIVELSKTGDVYAREMVASQNFNEAIILYIREVVKVRYDRYSHDNLLHTQLINKLNLENMLEEIESVCRLNKLDIPDRNEIAKLLIAPLDESESKSIGQFCNDMYAETDNHIEKLFWKDAMSGQNPQMFSAACQLFHKEIIIAGLASVAKQKREDQSVNRKPYTQFTFEDVYSMCGTILNSHNIEMDTTDIYDFIKRALNMYDNLETRDYIMDKAYTNIRARISSMESKLANARANNDVALQEQIDFLIQSNRELFDPQYTTQAIMIAFASAYVSNKLNEIRGER